MAEREFRVVGHGSDLAIELRGADLRSCLDAGAAGFAAALARVPDDSERESLSVVVEGDDPADLLVALFEEFIVAVDVDGVVPVGVIELEARAGRWDVVLETVRLGDLQVHGAAPKAATWHESSLAKASGGWEGRITLDL